MGLVGNIFCMAILWKPSEEYQVYGYQLALMINDICGLIAGTFWSTVSVWSNLKNRVGPVWAIQNSFIMWYAAHVSNLSTSIFLLNLCLFLAMMSGDRIWALYFPVSYHAKAMKQRAIMISGISLACLVSVGFSMPDYFRQEAVYNETIATYDIVINHDFSDGIFGNAVLYTRLGIRFGSFLAIIVASILITWKYRSLSVAKVGDSRWSRSDRNGQTHHKTFTMLTIAQVVLLVIGQAPVSVAYAMIYSGNDAWVYTTSRGRFFRDVVNLLDIAPYWANVLIFAAMSKAFRILAKERVVEWGKKMKEKRRWLRVQ